MSGRGNGKAKAGRGGRGKGRSGSQSTTTANSKGLCVALGNHMFDYNKKGAADQVKVRKLWTMLVHSMVKMFAVLCPLKSTW